MASDWVELGSVPGAHGALKAWRNPAGGVTLVDGASNSVVIPRLSLAEVAEILNPGTDTAVRAELATLRALRAVASDFAATWAELLWSLPDSYECHMNCPEANAAADLFRALGRDADADAIIAAHIEHDGEDERETHEPPATEARDDGPTRDEIDRCADSEDPFHRCPVCYDYAADDYRPARLATTAARECCGQDSADIGAGECRDCPLKATGARDE